MSVTQMQRPNFFEGQYLGEEDLDLAVEYNRYRHSRHVLGAHTWGIATGLQFREEEAAGGGAEIAVQPGYAVDGYGRQIVLSEPFALTADLFEGITGTASSVQVKVWIKFQGVQTNSPDDFFKDCDSEEQYARLQEGFGIVVARQGTFDHDDLFHDVTVAGESVSALEAPPSRAKEDPIHCDESVPYQTFPTNEEDPEQAWLIPLGYVRWNIATQSLEATTDDERYLTRTCRRYIGAVTEDILAADGLIRLRHRETDPPADETTPIDAACTERMLSDVPDKDLSLDADPARAMPIDLVWIEGNLRLIGDEKIYGGLIDFRPLDGVDEKRLIRRVDPNSKGGTDLQLVIGDQTDGDNRLAVGPYISPTEIVEHFVVRDNGFTGVQVGDPEYALQVGSGDVPVTLALRGPPGNAAANVLAFEDVDGNTGDWFQFVHNTAGPHQLFLNSAGMRPIMTFVGTSGFVGVGTYYSDVAADQPPKPLTVRGKGTGEELLGFENDAGDLKWHINQLLSGTRDGLNFVESGVKDGRLFLAAGGNTGINTVDPDAPLHVFGTNTGNDAELSAGSGILVIGDMADLNLVLDGNEIMARNNGSKSNLHLQTDGGNIYLHYHENTARRIVFQDDGDVGIGTTSPQAKLDVRGEIKLGALGDHYAASAHRTIVIVAGRVATNGAALMDDEYTSSKIATGVFRVDFNHPFDPVDSKPPSVVVSPIDSPANDRVMTVQKLTISGFEVSIKDVAGPGQGLRDNPFSFIAIGKR